MPGLYLAAIIISAAGIAVLDWRFTLALWRAPWRTTAAVTVCVIFFLVWDAVGIASGVFYKGGSALFVGVDIAPEIPLEEIFFLTFLCYLTIVCWTASMRMRARRTRRGAERT